MQPSFQSVLHSLRRTLPQTDVFFVHSALLFSFFLCKCAAVFVSSRLSVCLCRHRVSLSPHLSCKTPLPRKKTNLVTKVSESIKNESLQGKLVCPINNPKADLFADFVFPSVIKNVIFDQLSNSCVWGHFGGPITLGVQYRPNTP